MDTQYPQATKYPGNIPNPSFVYAYGPPVILGATLPRLPKTIANRMAPIDAKTHPIKLILPYNANVAGSKNMPEPTMLPTTREVLDQNPIFFCLLMILFYMKFNFRLFK
jgi:hypothetical protein